MPPATAAHCHSSEESNSQYCSQLRWDATTPAPRSAVPRTCEAAANTVPAAFGARKQERCRQCHLVCQSQNTPFLMHPTRPPANRDSEHIKNSDADVAAVHCNTVHCPLHTVHCSLFTVLTSALSAESSPETHPRRS